MDPQLERESDALIRSWMQYEEQMLADYLIGGVEDPRINVQSILTRHFLLNALFGSRFESLQAQELRFACVLNWLEKALPDEPAAEGILALRHALKTGADNAEGVTVPRFVARAQEELPLELSGIVVPNYLKEAMNAAERNDSIAQNKVRSTFEGAWSHLLELEAPPGASVLEVACGSANDYRFLHSFGIARLIDYAGIDLCEKNVRNATARFPRAGFMVGNAFALAAPDAIFDFCVVHDLFEHLSILGLNQALREICRVTRQGLCLGFFNLSEGEEHIVQPSDEYHWNKLSVPRLREALANLGFEAQVLHVDTFLRWRFGCGETHNRNAYTFFAARQGSEFEASARLERAPA